VVLVTSANGKTARAIIPQLVQRGEQVRAVSRHLAREVVPGVEYVSGDMTDLSVVARCVKGASTIVHIAPAFHPREVFMGTALIDAAQAAGASKFVCMSVIHSQIEELTNHSNKRSVESYLMRTRMDWSILQPQHYMQNIDIDQAIKSRTVALPYSPTVTLGFVDLRDVAEIVAKVATERGHRWATYELASSEHLSTEDIARTISLASGLVVLPGRLDVTTLVEAIAAHMDPSTFDEDSARGYRRLFEYYDQFGITGNGRILTWLLGRAATSFFGYCQRHVPMLN